MTAAEATATHASHRRTLLGIPLAAWLVALLAAAFHMLPFWLAERNTPEGWTFVGNVTVSPDYMQYRSWMRQTLETGPFVDNRFTTEPNARHLPVFFYWAIGRAAAASGFAPEYLYAYLGCVLAFGFALMLFLTVRHFFPQPHQTWWTFLTLLVGGGLGAHFKILAEMPMLRDTFLVSRFVSVPLAQSMMFEDYRSHYILKTLIDTHFLLIWAVSLAAVLAMYAAVRRATARRLALAAALSVAATFLHVYEGATLLAIAGAVLACCWIRNDSRANAFKVFVWCSLAVGASYMVLGAIYRASGLPVSPWRAVNVLALVLAIAYPVAWGLIAWGGRAYWKRAGTSETFIAGWVLGCTLLTLSAPFYPYPDRGTMTMQVAVTLMAAGIWFARFPRVSRRAAVVAVMLLGATPVWLVARTVRFTQFREDWPFAWITPSHQRVIGALRTTATREDALLAEGRDLLWIAPEYPGRHYAGHFFLTVDYDRKAADVERFFSGADSASVAVLGASGARFVFVNADRQPERFAGIEGLVPILREPIGWLFEVRRAEASVR